MLAVRDTRKHDNANEGEGFTPSNVSSLERT